MSKAIMTKYVSPTNTKGARVIASDCDGNKVTISYPHKMSGEAVYHEAAVALCDKMGWRSANLVAGAIKDGYVFVFVD